MLEGIVYFCVVKKHINSLSANTNAGSKNENHVTVTYTSLPSETARVYKAVLTLREIHIYTCFVECGICIRLLTYDARVWIASMCRGMQAGKYTSLVI